MLKRIQMMRRGQRVLIFSLFFGGGLMAILALTAFLILESLNSGPRERARTQLEGVTVAEFVELPDDDAYPATIAVAADGTVYTASYDTGAVWAITPDGGITELPNTRESIGSITGMTVGPDGTLYILDRIDSNPRAAGGMVWRIPPDGRLLEIGEIEGGFIAPHDIEIDAAGNLYVTDRGERQVWRFAADGPVSLWWEVPPDDPRAEEVIPTGLGYDAANDALLISDSEAGTIYRVSIASGETEIAYRYEGTSSPPGFDGVTAAPDGTIYAAAFGQRDVVRIQDGAAVVLARGFRGGSDLAYYDERLYVTNFDQRSLVLPGIEPQLPFTLDVITLEAAAS